MLLAAYERERVEAWGGRCPLAVVEGGHRDEANDLEEGGRIRVAATRGTCRRCGGTECSCSEEEIDAGGPGL
jgi:hypothetical protein